MEKLINTLKTQVSKDKSITIRFQSDMLEKVDRTAKELSLSRTGYIMALLEKDLENRKQNRKKVL